MIRVDLTSFSISFKPRRIWSRHQRSVFKNINIYTTCNDIDHNKKRKLLASFHFQAQIYSRIEQRFKHFNETRTFRCARVNKSKKNLTWEKRDGKYKQVEIIDLKTHDISTNEARHRQRQNLFIRHWP